MLDPSNWVNSRVILKQEGEIQDFLDMGSVRYLLDIQALQWTPVS